MLGQKEIFQCLIIAILLSIFNFYRSAIRRNEEIQKYKKLNKKHFKLDETNKLMDTVSPLLNEQLFAIVTHSLEFKNEYCCDQDCFEFAYEHYLKQQCSLNCCIFRNVTNNHPQDENHIQMDELKIIETNVTNIETTSALPTPPLTLDYIKTNLLDEDSPKNDENVILEDEYVHPIKKYGKYLFNVGGLIMATIALKNAIFNFWKNYFGEEQRSVSDDKESKDKKNAEKKSK